MATSQQTESAEAQHGRNSGGPIYTLGRLQLAAALIEYSNDDDDNDDRGNANQRVLAEQSAIFAPYRIPAYEYDGHVYVDQHAAGGDPEEERPELLHQGRRHDLDLDPEGVTMAWNTSDRRNSSAAYRPFNDYTSSRDSVDVDLNQAGRPGSMAVEGSFDAGIDEAELASEWGIDTVLSKFEDPSALRQYTYITSDAAAAATKSGNADASAKRDSLSTDLLLLKKGTKPHRKLQSIDRTLQEEMEEHLENLATDLGRPHGRPSSSLSSAPRRSMNVSRASFRSRSRASSSFDITAMPLVPHLDSFVQDDALDHAGGATTRASELDALSSDASTVMDNRRQSTHAILDHEGEEDGQHVLSDVDDDSQSDRGPSAYVSRFDPKAVAKLQAEQYSDKLRFPDSLYPKVLVMPAPLADLAFDGESSQPQQDAEADQAESNAQEEKQPPRIEREPGKLYGKSLMDELQERKSRLKSKQQAFRGDNRRAMMDNSMSQARLLQQIGGKSTEAEDSDDEEEPLSRAKARLSGVSAYHSLKATSTKQHASSENLHDTHRNKASERDDDKDPWAKYASRRSIFMLAGGSQGGLVASLAPPSPGQEGPDAVPSTRPTSQPEPPSMSTKELQQQYKRSKYLSSLSLSPAALGTALDKQQTLFGNQNMLDDADGDDEEEDDVPLETRRHHLVTRANQVGHRDGRHQAKDAGQQESTAPLASVFGQDIVMERELKKLEEILKIEEAERKMAAEKQRVLDAEREAKELKKRLKAEKKAKKKEKKKKNLTHEADEQEASPMSVQPRMITSIDGHGMAEQAQWQGPPLATDHRSSALSTGPDIYTDPQFGKERGSIALLPLPGELDLSQDEDGDAVDQASRPSESIAPSLELGFMQGLNFGRSDPSTTLLDDDGGQKKEGLTVVPSGIDEEDDWFGFNRKDDGGGRAGKDPSSDSSDDSDSEHARKKSSSRPVRCPSRLSVLELAADQESDEEPQAGTAATLELLSHEPPTLQAYKRADDDSFAGVLDSLGLRDKNSEEDDGCEDGDGGGQRRRRQKGFTLDRRSDDEEDELTIAKVIARRSAVWPADSGGVPKSNRIGSKPPIIDLAGGFGEDLLSPTNGRDGSRAKGADSDGSSSDSGRKSASSDTDEEDDVPLGVQRLHAQIAAKRKSAAALKVPRGHAKGDDKDEDGYANNDGGSAASLSSSDDDVPLALRDDDDKPLGEKHPLAAMSQQMEAQQRQNMLLMNQIQMQYQQQLQAQFAAAAAAMHVGGHVPPGSRSQMSGSAYEAPISMLGSDIGLNLPPDPKLVNSVDRWRQNVL